MELPTEYVSQMFETHYGSSVDGATVWWYYDSVNGKLQAYSYFKSFAHALIVDSS